MNWTDELIAKYPTLAQLCDCGDLTIRFDVDYPLCGLCGGTGRESATTAPPFDGLRAHPMVPHDTCERCGGSGCDMSQGRSLMALGIQPELGAGIRGATFTPWFDSMEKLEQHCAPTGNT